MPTGEARPDPPDPAELHDALKHALRQGAHAARLAVHAPGLVDQLAPPNSTADSHEQTSALYRRAYRAEQIIRAAIDEVGGESAAALSIMFELTRRTGHRPVEERRKAAARRLGIQPDTFRRNNHEGILILELAMQIYALMNGDNRSQHTQDLP